MSVGECHVSPVVRVMLADSWHAEATSGGADRLGKVRGGSRERHQRRGFFSGGHVFRPTAQQTSLPNTTPPSSDNQAANSDDTFIHFERHQLAAAPVLESIDALLVDDLSDDEDDVFTAAIGS